MNSQCHYDMVKKELKAFVDPSMDFFTDDEQLVAEGFKQGEHYAIRLRTQVRDSGSMISIFSLLPFVVPTEQAKTFAEKLSQFNYDTYYLGGYDFNPTTGKVLFRLSLPFTDKDEVAADSYIEALATVYNSVNTSAHIIENWISTTADESEEKASDVLAKIDSMIGWAEYKKLCHEIAETAPKVIIREYYHSFTSQSFLFAVDEGYGLTTALTYFTELMRNSGLFNHDTERTHCEEALTVTEKEGKYTLAQAIEQLDNSENQGVLVCYDISDFLDRSHRNELKNFLRKLAQYRDEYIFAFRVPFLEPSALESIRAVVADVLYVRTVSVPPFSNEQLKICAQDMLKNSRLDLDERGWEIFTARLCEEKSDGRFYGLRSVDNIVQEILWRSCVAATEEETVKGSRTDLSLISSEDISAISKTYNTVVRSGFDTLADMIGMESISEKIREIVTQVKSAMSTEGMERPCLHMRFTGAPGTGKTTVARIVGQIFRENGILRNGYFFEYSARDLCGAYVGQTAPKTASICRDAYGSVLFIDEAYALYQGGDADNKDYGREALTTLISEMENHRDDMVIIMAGYTDDMSKLMEGNAGLRSRMPFIIEFKSYTREQLFRIFMLFSGKHFTYTPEFEASARKYFDALSDAYIASKEFANARFVRNLYERTWSKAALRSSLSGEPISLRAEDFEAASSEKEFSEKLMVKNKLGF